MSMCKTLLGLIVSRSKVAPRTHACRMPIGWMWSLTASRTEPTATQESKLRISARGFLYTLSKTTMTGATHHV